jgi:hypothetical protein
MLRRLIERAEDVHGWIADRLHGAVCPCSTVTAISEPVELSPGQLITPEAAEALGLSEPVGDPMDPEDTTGMQRITHGEG